MSTIDEIINSFLFESRSQQRHRDDDRFQDTRDLIATALADARREGAEMMREAAAKLARKVPLHYGSGEPADEELAQAIEDFPLPTGERQAVLLTDEQIDRMIGMHWGDTGVAVQSVADFAARVEAAVLAANNLEVAALAAVEEKMKGGA